MPTILSKNLYDQMFLHDFMYVHLYVINQIKSSKYPTNMLVKIKQVKQ
jgi:hypothetical protein